MASSGTSVTLDVVDILGLYGFDATVPTKLVRHQDDLLLQLRRDNWLELYQSYQSRPVFHNTQQIVSFYGLSGNRAGFYGVYQVRGHHAASDGTTPEACPWAREWQRNCQYFYDLEPDKRFVELRDRLIIDWGKGTLAWVQKLTRKKPKDLLEIQALGRRLPPFDDYLEFSLTYAKLKELFENEEAHRDWRAHLSAVGGIYLILAEGSGKLYVGSASGVGGVWGRWRDYTVSGGHAGNADLKRLIASDPVYPDGFRFSLLQILPKTMARDLVIRREAIYKRKLGTLATGLNLN